MRNRLRWNLRCLRGRRCADLVFDKPEQVEAIERAGGTVKGTYTCGGCGTVYWMRKKNEPRRACTPEEIAKLPEMNYGSLGGGEAATLLVPVSGISDEEDAPRKEPLVPPVGWRL
jgi:hypothetical protein